MFIRFIAVAALIGSLLVSAALVAGQTLPRGMELLYLSYDDVRTRIYRYDLAHRLSAEVRLPIPGGEFAWSPDGERLVFSSMATGSRDLYLTDPFGESVRRLTDSAGADYRPRWSPDGMWIAYESLSMGEAALELRIMPAAGGAPRPVTSADLWVQQMPLPNYGSDGGYSADGVWLAFTELGYRSSVVIVSPSGDEWITFPPGTFAPAWRPMP